MPIGQVNFEELPCSNGVHSVGVVTLDNIASLNALTFEMLHQLKDQLDAWNRCERVACVWLEGSGGKAFCAGGDVRTMYQVMSEKAKNEVEYFCTRYFTLEYQLDYLIHTFSKPVIAWGDGIVMGGGMGLYMASSHKVVTAKSRLAMPEVSIGLYPDVGATWFLNRIDPSVGLFIGLTGAQINGCDALEVGLANHYLSSEQRITALEQLQICDWQDTEDRDLIVTELLEGLFVLNSDLKPEGSLTRYLDEIQTIFANKNLNQIITDFYALCRRESDRKEAIEPQIINEHQWLESAKRNLRDGSPITVHICFRQIKQWNTLSLAECFRLELGLSVRCATLGEFQEGVRARLVDKDGKPNWLFSSIVNVDESVIDGLFAPLWNIKQHPLARLGMDNSQTRKMTENKE
ncbi:enoyl-CoA hydratase/isomerase family protein [Vibrio tapetis]|uniref:3-hydroxyisobutyryl-CoA hydrolase n=1 Tax=Vibrio tapetis subsp. tapetis TaxID=1671868 RepID=A0A2N8ZII1_9VIBR|nr:enoyl-CoA hydratase/isomerase family protein [Vibrio tapetis]SON51709.1 Enoyl-CoA hydratase/isomerase family protein [Vibrio tapetis subsp. tapetis]